MPWGLKRYQQVRQLHFITFCCHHRAPYFTTPEARKLFVSSLERARCWYGFYVVGYVVMPEHVHLLISEPKRVEKLRYIHNNPVNRGLVISPEEWDWSSSRHYATGEESVVEIESWWTATRREALGVHPTIRRVS